MNRSKKACFQSFNDENTKREKEILNQNSQKVKEEMLSIISSRRDILIDKAILRWNQINEMQNLSIKTINSYNAILIPFFKLCKSKGQIYLGQITKEQLETYILDLKNNKSPKMANRFLKYIKTFYSKLEQDEATSIICPVINTKLIKIDKKKIVALSDEDLEQFFSLFDLNDFSGCRNFVLFQLILSTGLRITEALELKISDISFDQMFLIVQKAKSREARRVPFDLSMAQLLKDYLVNIRGTIPNEDHVFVNVSNQPLQYDAVKSFLQRIKNKMSLSSGKKLSPHQFRRTFATNYMREMKDIQSLKIILGHKDITTTQIYISENDEQIINKNIEGNGYVNHSLNRFLNK